MGKKTDFPNFEPIKLYLQKSNSLFVEYLSSNLVERQLDEVFVAEHKYS